MFCKNCGKELKDGSVFCSGCGAKIASKELRSDERAEGANTYFVNPGNENLPLAEKRQTSIFKIMGIFAGVLSFFSLLMDQVKVSNEGLDFLMEMGGSITGSQPDTGFFNMIKNYESGMFWMGLAVVSIILIIVCQLVNRPRLSVIGCIGISIVILFIVSAKHEANAYYDLFSYAAGYILLNAASIAAYVAAFKCKTGDNS